MAEKTTPLCYAPETILDQQQVAEWIGVSQHTVKEWPIPRLKTPGVKPLYSAGMVLAYLEGRLDVYLRRPV
jgi:hypothetical protein